MNWRTPFLIAVSISPRELTVLLAERIPDRVRDDDRSSKMDDCLDLMLADDLTR
jgi:hypothetical protein